MVLLPGYKGKDLSPRYSPDVRLPNNVVHQDPVAMLSSVYARAGTPVRRQAGKKYACSGLRQSREWADLNVIDVGLVV
jgi:hypothetical protein